MDRKVGVTDFLIMGVIVAIGFITANSILKANVYIARGLLGCAVIYLVFREIDFTMKDKSIQILYNFPNNIRHFAWIFGLSLALCWGLNYVIDLFLFFITRIF